MCVIGFKFYCILIGKIKYNNNNNNNNINNNVDNVFKISNLAFFNIKKKTLQLYNRCSKFQILLFKKESQNMILTHDRALLPLAITLSKLLYILAIPLRLSYNILSHNDSSFQL